MLGRCEVNACEKCGREDFETPGARGSHVSRCDPERDARMRAEYEGGATLNDVAEHFGFSRCFARKAIKRAGGTIRKPVKRDKKPKVRKPATRGESYKARKLGAPFTHPPGTFPGRCNRCLTPGPEHETCETIQVRRDS